MTAITCTAFSHSTMERLVGPAHEGNEARHVLGWRLRLDAVAQVEDEGPARDVRADRGAATRRSSAGPPASKSNGSRLPCTTVCLGSSCARNWSGNAQSQLTPSTPVSPA